MSNIFINKTSPLGDHGQLSGLTDNDHQQYATTGTVITVSGDFAVHTADTTIHFTEGSIDHGSIAGLYDNDHPQYRSTAVTISFSADCAQEGASTGDAVRWDGSNWIASGVSEGGGGGASTISGATDIEFPSVTPQDGDMLTYCAASETWISARQTPKLNGSAWHEDDFLSYRVEDGEIGELGWDEVGLSSQASTGVDVKDLENHPGIFWVQTTSITSWRYIAQGTNATTQLRPGNFSEVVSIVGVADQPGVTLTGGTGFTDIRIGIGNAGSHSSAFIGFVYLGLDTNSWTAGTASTWYAVSMTNVGANTTMTDTGIEVTNSDWYKLHTKMNWDADPITVEYYIDDVLVATHTSGTSNIPTSLSTLTTPTVSLKTNGAAHGLGVDYFAWRTRGIRR